MALGLGLLFLNPKPSGNLDKMAGDYDEGRHPPKKTQTHTCTHFPTHTQASTKNGAVRSPFQRFKRPNPRHADLKPQGP